MRIRSLHLLAPAMALAIMIPAEALSQSRAGGARGGAPAARPQAARMPANAGQVQRVQGSRDVRSSAQRSVNPNRGNMNNPNRGNVNIGSGGNTVVVRPGNNARPPNRPYGPPPPGYRPGGYYGNGGGYYYDDRDDNEFLEFVGKTAAVTAGAAIVGSIVTNKPTESNGSDCSEQISDGQVYLYCNGKYYQPLQTGSGTAYQVTNPPPR
jgi:hypothetical protein